MEVELARAKEDIEKHIAAAQQRAEEHQSQGDQLIASHAQLKATEKQMSDARQAAQDELIKVGEQHAERMQQMEAEVAQAKIDMGHYIAAAQDGIKYGEQLIAKTAELHALQQQLEDLQSSTKNERVNAAEQVRQLQDDLLRLHADNDKLADLTRASRDELVKSDEQVRSLQELSRYRDAAAPTVKSNVEQHQRELAELQARLSLAEAGHAEAVATAQEQAAFSHQQSQSLISSQAEIKVLLQRLAELEQLARSHEIEQHVHHVRPLEAALANQNMDEHIAAAQQTVDEQQKRTEQFEAAQLEAVRQQLEDVRQSAQNDLAELERQHAEQVRQLEAEMVRAKNDLGNYISAAQDGAKHGEQLVAKNVELQALQHERAKADSHHSEQLRQLQDEHAKQNEQYSEQVSKLQDERAGMAEQHAKRVKQLQDELLRLEADSDNKYRELCAVKDAEIKALADELAQAVQSSQSELARLTEQHVERVQQLEAAVLQAKTDLGNYTAAAQDDTKHGEQLIAKNAELAALQQQIFETDKRYDLQLEAMKQQLTDMRLTAQETSLKAEEQHAHAIGQMRNELSRVEHVNASKQDELLEVKALTDKLSQVAQSAQDELARHTEQHAAQVQQLEAALALANDVKHQSNNSDVELRAMEQRLLDLTQVTKEQYREHADQVRQLEDEVSRMRADRDRQVEEVQIAAVQQLASEIAAKNVLLGDKQCLEDELHANELTIRELNEQADKMQTYQAAIDMRVQEKENEVHQLLELSRSAQGQLNQLCAQLDNKTALLSYSEESNKALSNELASAQEELDNLRHVRATSESVSIELQKERHSLDAARAELSEQKSELEQSRRRIQQEDAELRKREAAVDAELLQVQNHSETARRLLETEKQQIEFQQQALLESAKVLSDRKKAIKTAEADCEQVRAALDQQRDELTHQRQTLLGRELEQSKQQAEIDSFRQSIDSDRAAFEQAQTELGILQAELAQRKEEQYKSVSALEEQIHKLEAEKTQLEAQLLEHSRATQDGTQEYLRVAQEQIDKLDKDLTAESARLQVQRAALDHAQSDIAQQQARIDAQEQQLNADSQQLLEQKAILEKTREGQVAEQERFALRQSELDQVVALSQQQQLLVEQQLAEARKELSNKQQSLDAAEMALRQLHQENEAIIKTIGDREQRIASLLDGSPAAAEPTSSNVPSNNDIESAQVTIQGLEAQLHATNEDIGLKTQMVNELDGQLSALNEAFVNRHREHERQIQSKEHENGLLLENVRSLRAEMQARSEEAHEYSAALKQQLADAAQALGAEEGRLKKVRAKKAKLRQRISELQATRYQISPRSSGGKSVEEQTGEVGSKVAQVRAKNRQRIEALKQKLGGDPPAASIISNVDNMQLQQRSDAAPKELQIEERQQEIQQRERDLALLKSDLDQRRAELDAKVALHIKQLSALETRHKHDESLEEQLAQAHKQAEHSEANASSLKRENEAIIKTLADREQRIAALLLSNDRDSSALEQLRAQLLESARARDELRQSLEAPLAELTRTVADLRLRLEQADQAKQVADASLQSAQATAIESRQEHERQAEQLRDLQNRIEQLRANSDNRLDELCAAKDAEIRMLSDNIARFTQSAQSELIHRTEQHSGQLRQLQADLEAAQDGAKASHEQLMISKNAELRASEQQLMELARATQNERARLYDEHEHQVRDLQAQLQQTKSDLGAALAAAATDNSNNNISNNEREKAHSENLAQMHAAQIALLEQRLEEVRHADRDERARLTAEHAEQVRQLETKIEQARADVDNHISAIQNHHGEELVVKNAELQALQQQVENVQHAAQDERAKLCAEKDAEIKALAEELAQVAQSNQSELARRTQQHAEKVQQLEEALTQANDDSDKHSAAAQQASNEQQKQAEQLIAVEAQIEYMQQQLVDMRQVAQEERAKAEEHAQQAQQLRERRQHERLRTDEEHAERVRELEAEVVRAKTDLSEYISTAQDGAKHAQLLVAKNDELGVLQQQLADLINQTENERAKADGQHKKQMQRLQDELFQVTQSSQSELARCMEQHAEQIRQLEAALAHAKNDIDNHIAAQQIAEDLQKQSEQPVSDHTQLEVAQQQLAAVRDEHEKSEKQHTQQLQQLHNELLRLEDESNQKYEELVQAKDSQVKALANELAQAREHNQEARAELEHQHAEQVRQLQAEVVQARIVADNYIASAQEAAEYGQQLAVKIAEFQAVQQQLDDLTQATQDERAVAVATFQQLRLELEAGQKQLEDLKNLRATSQLASDELVSELDSAKAELSQLKVDLRQQHQEDGSELQHLLSVAQQQLEERERETVVLKGSLSATQQELVARTSRDADAQAELANAERTLQSLKTALHDTVQEKDELIAELRDQIALLTAQFEEFKRETESVIQSEIAARASAAESDAVKSLTLVLERRIKERDEELHNIERDLEAKIEAREHELHEQLQRVERWKAEERRNRDTNLVELQEELERVQLCTQALRDELRQVLSEKQAQDLLLEGTKAVSQQRDIELSIASQREADQAAELDICRKTIGDLQAANDSQQQALTDAAQALRDLQYTLNDSQRQLTELRNEVSLCAQTDNADSTALQLLVSESRAREQAAELAYQQERARCAALQDRVRILEADSLADDLQKTEEMLKSLRVEIVALVRHSADLEAENERLSNAAAVAVQAVGAPVGFEDGAKVAELRDALDIRDKQLEHLNDVLASSMKDLDVTRSLLLDANEALTQQQHSAAPVDTPRSKPLSDSVQQNNESQENDDCAKTNRTEEMLNTLATKLANKRAKLSDALEEITRLREQLEQANEQVEVGAQAERMVEASRNLTQELADARITIGVRDGEIASLQRHVDSFKSYELEQADTALKQLEAKDEEIRALNRRIEEFKAKEGALQERIEHLGIHDTEQADLMRQLPAEVRALQDTSRHNLVVAPLRETGNEAIAKERQHSDDSFKHYQHELEAKDNELRALQAHVDSFKSYELEQADTALKQLEAKNEELRAARLELADAVKAVELKNEEIRMSQQAANENASKRVTAATNAHVEEMRALKQQADSSMKQYQDELEAREAEIRALQEHVDSFKSYELEQADASLKQIEAKNEEIRALTDQVQQLKSTLSEALSSTASQPDGLPLNESETELLENLSALCESLQQGQAEELATQLEIYQKAADHIATLEDSARTTAQRVERGVELFRSQIAASIADIEQSLVQEQAEEETIPYTTGIAAPKDTSDIEQLLSALDAERDHEIEALHQQIAMLSKRSRAQRQDEIEKQTAAMATATAATAASQQQPFLASDGLAHVAQQHTAKVQQLTESLQTRENQLNAVEALLQRSLHQQQYQPQHTPPQQERPPQPSQPHQQPQNSTPQWRRDATSAHQRIDAMLARLGTQTHH
eukprot:TRINITY_DN1353_c0_g1_i3.p1 TRINITY_DN1353_c0_g1~~TRINITY_DN1353_c0_g1_i3.p1  ORF type:complete len:3545 (-),score=988.82 TRINITY_DN1353_c0_g1_i3:59-10240(-)